MIDIYSQREITTRSKEHILQNELGGKLQSAELIDKETNDCLGSTIDADLGRALHWIRVQLSATSGDGVLPSKMSVQTPEARYNILPGGKPERGKPQISVVKDSENHVVKISGYARSEQELRTLTKRILEKYSITEETFRESIEHRSEFLKPFDIDFELTPSTLRGVAKIACNLLALHDKVLFLRDDFNPIRRFIYRGTGDIAQFVHINTSSVLIGENGRNLGQLDHLIVVQGTTTTGHVRALVCLFKHLQFIVTLGTVSLDKDFVYTYRVDQLGKQYRMNDPKDFFPIPSRYQQKHFERTLKRAVGSINDVINSRKPNILEQITQQATVDIFGSHDESNANITQEDMDRLRERIIEYLLQAG